MAWYDLLGQQPLHLAAAVAITGPNQHWAADRETEEEISMVSEIYVPPQESSFLVLFPLLPSSLHHIIPPLTHTS